MTILNDLPLSPATKLTVEKKLFNLTNITFNVENEDQRKAQYKAAMKSTLDTVMKGMSKEFALKLSKLDEDMGEASEHSLQEEFFQLDQLRPTDFDPLTDLMKQMIEHNDEKLRDEIENQLNDSFQEVHPIADLDDVTMQSLNCRISKEVLRAEVRLGEPDEAQDI